MGVEEREKIVHIYQQNPTWSQRTIAKVLGIPKSTVGSVIKRFNDTLSIQHAKGNGRKSGPSDKILAQKIIRSIKQNPGLSDDQRAKNCGTSKSTGRRTRLRSNLKSYRAIKVPNRKDQQIKSIKNRSRLLYDEILTKFDGCLVMDDETYVKVDQGQIPGQKFYVATHRLNVPDKYKYVKVDKFGKKLLIWQAICSCGLKSKAFVTSKTLNSELYMKECLEKRLLPFIKQHRSPVMFWPDLASCHYSRATQGWYEANQVNIVPKELNPPNCPEFRPIEKYWAIVKDIFRKTRAAITNDKSMLAQWNKCANKVARSLVQDMMSSIKRKVRDYIRNDRILP